VVSYDVTVRTGTSGPSAALYEKADLTANILDYYSEGDRLTVRQANKSWARVYDGATDRMGYMLLEELEEDLFEEELLEDDE